MIPLVHVEDGLLVGPHGEAAALFELPTRNYAHLTESAKLMVFRSAKEFAAQVGADFSIYRVQEQHDGYQATRVFLLVALKEPTGSVRRRADRVRRQVEAVVGLGSTQPYSEAELGELRQRVQELLDLTFSLWPRTSRVSAADIQWLLRRAPLRGTNVGPELDRNGTRVRHHLMPAMTEHARLASGHGRYLHLEADEGESLQAVLVMGAAPERVDFPGARAELMFAPLDKLRFPVDAVLRVRWVPPEQALGRMRKRAADAEVELDESASSGFEPGVRRQTVRELARERQADLESDPQPELDCTLLIAVGAESPRDLRERCQAVKSVFGDIRLHRPPGLQAKLWWDTVPHPGPITVPDYVEPFTVDQFAALTPTGIRACGSREGPYLGYTVGGVGQPASKVLLDPAQAAQEDLPTAILSAGILGSGKTLAAQWIAYLAAKRGSYVLTVDPKPDHRLAELDEFADSSEVVDLVGGESQAGLLDPMAHQLPGMREELTTSYLLELVPPDVAGRYELPITQAVADELAGVDVVAPKPSLSGVVRRLEASDNAVAEEAGRALSVIARGGLGSLAFGEGKHRDLALHRVRTIRTHGLDLPPAGALRNAYTRGERIAVATLRLVAARALELVTFDRSQHKIVILDEGWVFLGSQQGRAMLDRLIRLGRAYNATVIVCTQTLGELGTLEELFGIRMAFGHGSRPGAERALQTLRGDTEPDERLIEDLQSMRAGRCLMRDLEGRIAEVQIDIPPDLVKALSTTPGQWQPAREEVLA